MKIKIFPILSLTVLLMLTSIPQAFSFDVNSFNMTLSDVQKTEYTNYDILTLVFSLFNGGNELVVFSNHSMLYLNDTSGDNWEYSSYLDLVGYSSTDCPELDVFINSNNSADVKLCYIVINNQDVGYSLILNNNHYFKNWDTKEFVLESVPDWFKSTANAWCTDVISDDDFVNSTQFYIEQETIKVLRAYSGPDVGAQIPVWVKNNACLWSDNQISDYEFLDGIYWLIDNGKIQL